MPEERPRTPAEWRAFYAAEDAEYTGFTRKRTPWVALAMEIMADGQWHDREQVVGKAAHLVPPGKAVRWVRNQRRNSVNRHKRRTLTPEEFAEWEQLPDEDKYARDPHRGIHSMQDEVRAGQRAIVQDAIVSNKRTLKRLNPETGVPEIRRLPFHAAYAQSNAALERRLAEIEGRKPRRMDTMSQEAKEELRRRFT